jgi:hypothetical protein
VGRGKHNGVQTCTETGKRGGGGTRLQFNAISFESVKSELTINSKNIDAGCFERKCLRQQQAQRGAPMVTGDTELDRVQALFATR